MPEEEDYLADAREDAASAVEHFEDEIVEQIVEGGKASDDMNNDFPNGDSYHHESHVDRHYSLLQAAKLLDQLGNYEETDRGLWEGLDPREAVKAQAAYTYGNAVYSLWQDLIKEINEEIENQGESPEGPKEWNPRKGTHQSWAKKIVSDVLKKWR